MDGSVQRCGCKLAVERIGVFGGTFDPPHWGHLATALEAYHRLQLNRVLLVVANDPWQKSALAPVTPAAIRLALTVAAADGLEGLEASDLEIKRGGPSSTVETLETLASKKPDASLFMIVGSDAAAGLDTWKRGDDIMGLARTIVVDRGGRQGGRPYPGWPHTVIAGPALEISSADLRARFADGRPVEALTPRAVVNEIRSRGLYGSGR